jgi:hypothetical protein
MSNEAERQSINTPPAGTDPRFDEMAARDETVNPGPEARADATRADETRREESPRDVIADQGAGLGAGTDLMSGYRVRFAEVQARFIDDPHAAVDGARSLVEEAVDRMMRAIGSDLGDKADTEQMRRAIQRYRDVMERIGSTPS